MDHVYNAFDLLNTNGSLISIVSRRVFLRSYKKDSDFHEFVSKQGYSIELPDNSFTGSQSFSQTAVNTNYVILKK